jgi:cellulose synthase/poly-beta-1,6-N-acetylglucosamine synthase-like glycosyltransferase
MFISVVIPTYNRLPILEKCLRALEAQHLEAPLRGFEVVLVDDGSTDETVAWLTAQASDLPHVRLIQQSHGGDFTAREHKVAQTDLLIHILVNKALVHAFITPTQQHSAHARRPLLNGTVVQRLTNG